MNRLIRYPIGAFREWSRPQVRQMIRSSYRGRKRSLGTSHISSPHAQCRRIIFPFDRLSCSSVVSILQKGCAPTAYVHAGQSAPRAPFVLPAALLSSWTRAWYSRIFAPACGSAELTSGNCPNTGSGDRNRSGCHRPMRRSPPSCPASSHRSGSRAGSTRTRGTSDSCRDP